MVLAACLQEEGEVVAEGWVGRVEKDLWEAIYYRIYRRFVRVGDNINGLNSESRQKNPKFL